MGIQHFLTCVNTLQLPLFHLVSSLHTNVPFQRISSDSSIFYRLSAGSVAVIIVLMLKFKFYLLLHDNFCKRDPLTYSPPWRSDMTPPEYYCSPIARWSWSSFLPWIYLWNGPSFGEPQPSKNNSQEWSPSALVTALISLVCSLITGQTSPLAVGSSPRQRRDFFCKVTGWCLGVGDHIMSLSPFFCYSQVRNSWFTSRFPLQSSQLSFSLTY